jgi:conjugative transfer signal peptidase TraF
MKIPTLLATLIGLGLVVSFLGVIGLRFNVTASLPLGIYRVTADRPTRGSIVHVCLPSNDAEFARQRGYLGPGDCPRGVRPLGKIVLAVEGDRVRLQPESVQINGNAVSNSATATEDSHGRTLPHFPWGEHRLGRGELWLHSPYHRNAYDSRYFGPVQESLVVSVLQPLLTHERRSDRATHVPRSGSDSHEHRE